MYTPNSLSLVLLCFLTASSLYGQELPLHAIARLGDYRFHHGSSIELVAMAPDGSHVASLARKPSYFRHITDKDRDPFDRTIVVWDTATGLRHRELVAPDYVTCLTYSPDSKQLLAVCGDAENQSHLTFFDVATGKIVDRIGGFKERVKAPQFSADGKQLMFVEGLWEATAMTFDLASKKPLRTWKAPAPKSEWVKEREIVTRALPSPDGKFIAWHVDELPDYSKVPPDVHVAPWVPHPRTVVVSDTATDKPLYRKELPKHDLGSFAFSADSRWFVAHTDKKFTAWKTATGQEHFSLDDPSASRIALSPDGCWALNMGNRRCRLWDLASKKPKHELHGNATFDYHDSHQQIFSADGKPVALWTYSTLRLFDTTTGKERLKPGHHNRNIMVHFSADGHKLLTACDEMRCTWELSPDKQPALLDRVARKAWDTGGNQKSAQSNDSRFFLDDKEYQIRIRDTATGKVVHELEKDKWSGTFARFSPDASRLALRRYLMITGTDEEGNYFIQGSGEPERLKLYDTKTGKRTGEISLKDGVSWAIPTFSPDAKSVAYGDRFNDVHLHDAVTGNLIRTFHSAEPLARKECSHVDAMFSPDGQRLIVTTYWHELFADPNDAEKWTTMPTRVFEVASGKEMHRFYGNPEKTRRAAEYSCTACSPDNRLLAVAENESNVIRLIAIADGKTLAEFKGHRDGVNDLAFSPDGKLLASGGKEDNVVYLWDVAGVGRQR
jgi:WD40 repeat protein